MATGHTGENPRVRGQVGPVGAAGLVDRYHELLFFRHPRARNRFPSDLKVYAWTIEPTFRTIFLSLNDTLALGRALQQFVDICAEITDDPKLLGAMGESLTDALEERTGPWWDERARRRALRMVFRLASQASSAPLTLEPKTSPTLGRGKRQPFKEKSREAMDESQGRALFRRGQKLLAQERHREALSTFRESLRCDPGKIRTRVYVAWAAHKSGKLPREALIHFLTRLRSEIEYTDPTARQARAQLDAIVKRLSKQ